RRQYLSAGDLSPGRAASDWRDDSADVLDHVRDARRVPGARGTQPLRASQLDCVHRMVQCRACGGHGADGDSTSQQTRRAAGRRGCDRPAGRAAVRARAVLSPFRRSSPRLVRGPQYAASHDRDVVRDSVADAGLPLRCCPHRARGGTMALSVAKGGRLHKRSGLVFTCAMTATGVLTGAISVYEGKSVVGGTSRRRPGSGPSVQFWPPKVCNFHPPLTVNPLRGDRDHDAFALWVLSSSERAVFNSSLRMSRKGRALLHSGDGRDRTPTCDLWHVRVVVLVMPTKVEENHGIPGRNQS